MGETARGAFFRARRAGDARALWAIDEPSRAVELAREALEFAEVGSEQRAEIEDWLRRTSGDGAR